MSSPNNTGEFHGGVHILRTIMYQVFKYYTIYVYVLKKTKLSYFKGDNA